MFIIFRDKIVVSMILWTYCNTCLLIIWHSMKIKCPWFIQLVHLIITFCLKSLIIDQFVESSHYCNSIFFQKLKRHNCNVLHLSRIFGITFVEKIYVSPHCLLTSYIHSRSFDFGVTKQHLQDIKIQRYSEN